MPLSSTSLPLSARQATSAPELLAALYPPLARCFPHLATVSAPQAAFLLLDQREAFYGGAAGGGKSDALLAAALQYVDTPGYSALILRRTFADLALPGAIMARSHEWLTGFAAWNDTKKLWTFPSGATLAFGYLDAERDVYRYQGAEFQFVAFDELTQFPEGAYTYLFSRLRRLAGVDVPIRMRSASNPGGVGHGWVKRRFIERRAPDVVFVPAKVDDNPGLDVEEYRRSLMMLPEVLRAQLLAGDWGAFEGAAFPEFGDAHVVSDFRLVESFERFECMDYGLNNPTAWHLVAVDYDGNLVFCDSVYRPGLPSETAAEVLRRRRAWWGEDNWCWADPSIRSRNGSTTRLGEPASVHTEFADAGVSLSLANNDPRAGYARLRELIRPDGGRRFPGWHPRRGELGSPRLFVVGPRCGQLVEQLRAAPLQPVDRADAGEKIDPRWESAYGHAVAAARYGVMSRPDPSAQPTQYPEDPRARALVELREREAEEDPDFDPFVRYVSV